ncbi:GNAT family N-acetyltransferase [Mesorhizobium sp. M1005]|uniref:GNAT family N-acetyltransferase n=1 Tax=unclassified Mesorhizobium TaxID=325217 RepID=UPI00333D9AD2
MSAAQKWLGDESPSYPHFALAFVDGEVCGLASVAIAHPGIDLERLLFLKDLFVRDTARDDGVGRALMAFLAGNCMREGIGRIDLTTETGTKARCASTSDSARSARARRSSSGFRARR